MTLWRGEIDAGVLWGPMAGYFAQHATPHLTVVPLLKEGRQMDFRIAMGVRRTDQEWKRKLNRLIAENQPEIDQILRDYGVPLLMQQGKLKHNERPADAAAARFRQSGGLPDRGAHRRTVRLPDGRLPGTDPGNLARRQGADHG